MKPTIRVLLSSATIFGYLKLTFALHLNIQKPDTVLISVPFDQLQSIKWLENPNYMKSTCGTFKAYNTDTIKKIAGRWYTTHMSSIPSTTDHCSQFTNIRSPCKCIGIDFTIAMKENIISFVTFSTNTLENSVTYEMATASFVGNTQLNMNEIILRSFLVKSNAKMKGLEGYIIPSGVIIDSDDFKSYMIMVFCKEKAKEPIVMILVNALPISERIINITTNYLKNNKIKTKLSEISHKNCKYGKNIVGY
ncbi:unnamed protein product [Aphis gossypii]|uniref:Uncharacterized protein n=1 Tax=Aphis gossypii TaxID=80765 RepID=A0A9P0IX71_APHGO|nr:unnamed protein product [Aphis gossypii]